MFRNFCIIYIKKGTEINCRCSLVPLGSYETVLSCVTSWVTIEVDICLCLPPGRTWHKVNDLKVDYSGNWEKVRSGSSRDTTLAGLCWSSAHFVQCEPNELCRTWTQSYVRARMPDYSLNWTKRSSDIKYCQWHHRPPEGGPGAIQSRICPWSWTPLRAEARQPSELPVAVRFRKIQFGGAQDPKLF